MLIVVLLLLAVKHFSGVTQKRIASIQRCVGSNVVDLGRLLQSLADGIKFLINEIMIFKRVHTFCRVYLSLAKQMLNKRVPSINPSLFYFVIPFSTGDFS